VEDTYSFWKNLILVIIFFVVTPITLVASIVSLISLSKTKDLAIVPINNYSVNSFHQPSGLKVFASLPVNFPSVSGEIFAADARGEILKAYLKSYNSPLEPYSNFSVEMADKYGLDFRLTTAIAQQESNLCKLIPPESYNCWGWGIHSKGTLGFTSYQQGIEEVSRGLREEYVNKGFVTTDQVMSKYTPLSNGSWAFGVNKFMSEME